MTQRGEPWVQQAQSDLAVGRLTAEGVHAEASNQAWQGAEAMGCRASMVRQRALPAPPFVGPCRIRTSRLTKPSLLISHQFMSGVVLRGQRVGHNMGTVLDGTLPAHEVFRTAQADFSVARHAVYNADMRALKGYEAITRTDIGAGGDESQLRVRAGRATDRPVRSPP